MRDPDAAFLAALQAGRHTSLVPVQFVWVVAKNRDNGNPATVGVWTGDEPITATVISGTTGGTVQRTYIGGVSLNVPPIPRVADLTKQRVSITLSQIADSAQAIVRQYEPRLAHVEIHDGLLDPQTRALVSAPEIAFIGIVDGAPIETPAVDGDGSITIEVVSEAMAMLTRTNPAMRSDAHQRTRSSTDTFSVHAGTAGQWTVWWGEEPAERREGRGRGRRRA